MTARLYALDRHFAIASISEHELRVDQLRICSVFQSGASTYQIDSQSFCAYGPQLEQYKLLLKTCFEKMRGAGLVRRIEANVRKTKSKDHNLLINSNLQTPRFLFDSRMRSA